MAIKPLLKTTSALISSVILTSVCMISSSQAHWSLINDSSTLSFVTVKADHVGEVHTFDMLSGEIEDDGMLSITIELTSVNTLIPIRNERMQAMLFETNMFPRATVSATIDIEALGALEAGSTQSLQVDFELSVHGSETALAADLQVTRTTEGLVASTVKPIIVTADSVGLVAGVEQLREVAGLPIISRAVPVSFSVVFEQGH